MRGAARIKVPLQLSSLATMPPSSARRGADKRTRAWMELDATALRSNLRSARESVGPTASLIPMVKADAYGLGVSKRLRCLHGDNGG